MKKLKTYSHTMLALVLFGLAGAQQPGNAQEKAADARTLKVTLRYTGAGTVDEKHKIFLFLFDTASVNAESMPIDVSAGAAKNATVTFSNVAKSPVYVVAAYDPSGAYDATSAPPAGSSLGVHGKTPGELAPIAIDAGKMAQIDLAFDDSLKMQ
jgi:hypothetical protein